jgi:hypothetical protein
MGIQKYGDDLGILHNASLTNKATLREFQPLAQVQYLDLQ